MTSAIASAEQAQRDLRKPTHAVFVTCRSLWVRVSLGVRALAIQ